MAIELERETEQRILESIVDFFREELDQEIGDLKARLVLRFVLKEIAPSAYNQAVFDVKKHLGDVLDEIEGVCFEPEFGYWKKRRHPGDAGSA